MTLLYTLYKQALAASAAAAGSAAVSPGIGGKKRPGAGGVSVSLDPAVRSVFASKDGHRLLVGTRGGELYEMSTVDGSDAGGGGRGGGTGGVGPLTAGHGRGQVRCLCFCRTFFYRAFLYSGEGWDNCESG